MSFIELNSSIPLFVHLEDDINNLFVLATLTDVFNVELPDSPKPLINNLDGTYSDSSIAKPRGDVRVIYKVFDDAAFTLPNVQFQSAVEVFKDMPILILPSSVDIEVKSDPEISVAVESQKPIDIAVIQDPKIDVAVEPENKIDVLVSQDEVINIETLKETEINVVVDCP